MSASLLKTNSLRLRLGVALFGAGLALQPPVRAEATGTAIAPFDRGAAIARELADARAGNVLVAIHRADWRTHPENSLPAIRSAIAMGVEIIEIDVHRTKDGRFVIIHDRTLDRTTTGRGLVADHTLAELRELRLRDGGGSPTAERIPTLEEALDVVRGRAVVNLDRSFDHPAEVFRVVEQERALDFVLFAVNQPLDEFEAAYPGLLERMPLFMLVVEERVKDRDALIGPYLERRPPTVLQLVFSRDTDPVLGWIERARERGVRVWINTLWPRLSGGHHDDRALTDPEGSFGWVVARGATVIQTDRPQLLLDYLRQAGLRR